MAKSKGAAPGPGRGIPAARAVDLAGLVEYADGAIVSRTIAENDAGTMTVFAFDAGQGLSEHTVPFDALVQVLDGQAEITIGTKTAMPRAGQVVLMPANAPHSVRAPGRFKMLLTMLRQRG